MKGFKIRKGIVLITAIIVVVVVSMLLSVLVGDLRSGMYFAGNFSIEQRAYWAALAGLAYAEHMISLNGKWKGNSTAISIDKGGIYVEEGYVVGGIKQEDAIHGLINNGESEFYIAFATAPNKITPVQDIEGNQLNWYSHNNLAIPASTTVPVNLSNSARQLPANSLYVSVEGRSRKGRSYMEAIYVVDYSEGLPGVTLASGTMNIQLKNGNSRLQFTHSAGNNPKVHSNQDITISDNTTNKRVFNISQGTAFAKNNISVNGMAVTPMNQGDFGIKAELGVDSSDEFPRLSWQKATEKYGDPDDATSLYTASLQAGSYVYLEDVKNSGKYNLMYYDKPLDATFAPDATGIPFKDNKATLLKGSGVSVTNDGVGVDASSLSFSTSAPTAIKAITDNGGVNSFALTAYDWDDTAKSYTPTAKARTRFTLQASSDPNKAACLSANGDLNVKGELSGSGSVISGGMIDFEGKSTLKPDTSTGLAVYAKADINLHPISARESYSDPKTPLRTGMNNYIKSYTSTYTDKTLAARYLLDSAGEGGAKARTLREILTKDFGYSDSQAQTVVLKLLTTNSKLDPSGFILTAPGAAGWEDISFTDSTIQGIIYTWRNFNADCDGGSLTIRGALVAYGGDPFTQRPGEDHNGGSIAITNGDIIDIIYDPNYLSILGGENTKVRIKKVAFNRL
jgi:hypothetical protein